MTNIIDLKKQIKELKRKSALDLKKTELKAELKALTRIERSKVFDKKHKVLGELGRLGSRAGKTLKKVGVAITTPLTPAQQKAMNIHQKKLKELLEKEY